MSVAQQRCSIGLAEFQEFQEFQEFHNCWFKTMGQEKGWQCITTKCSRYVGHNANSFEQALK